MAGKSLKFARVLGDTQQTQIALDLTGVPQSIRINTPGLRNALGEYQRREQRAIADAVRINRQNALDLQQHVVDIVSTFNNRPSTGRLRKAMASNQNISVNAAGQGFGFGNPAYLNGKGSPALYWRTIDEGSKATFSRGGFAGTKIYPLVFPKRVPQSRFLAWYSGVTPDNKPAGRPGSSKGKIAAVTAAVGIGFETDYPGYEPIIVKREIAPHNYFSQGLQEMLPEIRKNRALKVALDTAWKGPGR